MLINTFTVLKYFCIWGNVQPLNAARDDILENFTAVTAFQATWSDGIAKYKLVAMLPVNSPHKKLTLTLKNTSKNYLIMTKNDRKKCTP